MPKEPLEDFTKMLGGAMNSLGTLRQEGEQMLRDQLQYFLSKMDLVRREEFEVLQERIALLESRIQSLESSGSKDTSEAIKTKSTASGNTQVKNPRKTP